MTPEAVSARKKELAIWLREGLVKLGPTFIKIGQQFSTRVDVLSQEFVKELEKLQVMMSRGSIRGCQRFKPAPWVPANWVSGTCTGFCHVIQHA